MKRKLMIYYLNNQEKQKVSYDLKMLTRRSVKAVLDYEGFGSDCEVSLTFTDDAGIRELNKSFRGIDKATDVLSFPLENFEKGDYPDFDFTAMLGDIVISLETAVRQAEEFGHSMSREVAFLCVHSMLHLLGYDHEADNCSDIEMRSRQSEILEAMGLGVTGEEL